MRRLLESLRQTLSPEARLRDVEHWRYPPPPWLGPSDALFPMFREIEEVLRLGRLTWGHVFMGNSELWGPGEGDAPIGVLYSFDPSFEGRPDRLQPIGERLFAYHGSDEPPPRRPWERAVRDALHTGLERPLHQELPPSLAGGKVVYHSTAMAHRGHLPGGQLSGTLLPILVQTGRTPGRCMPVPHRYWPREILAGW